MNYKIRRMKPYHLREVLAIEKASFPIPWSRSAFLSELINNQYAHYFVCLHLQGIIGYGGLWTVLGEAHVTTLAVHPRYRKCRVGSALLHVLLSTAGDKGAEGVTLEVRGSNEAARKLYLKTGFTPVGVRRCYYTDNKEDAIVMYKEVSIPIQKNPIQKNTR